MRWRGSDGNPSLRALFNDFGTAMGTGPTYGGTVGGVGFNSGLSTSFK